MHYSDHPGHVKMIRFFPGGKWKYEDVLDMSSVYNFGITPYDAVEEAIKLDHKFSRSILQNYTIVVPEPYHIRAYPVMLVPHYIQEYDRTHDER